MDEARLRGSSLPIGPIAPLALKNPTLMGFEPKTFRPAVRRVNHYTSTHTSTNTLKLACVRARTHTHIHTHKHIQHAYTATHTHTSTLTHAHTTHTHSNIQHTHTHTHARTHARTRARNYDSKIRVIPCNSQQQKRKKGFTEPSYIALSFIISRWREWQGYQPTWAPHHEMS